jgi:hypothetical protein
MCKKSAYLKSEEVIVPAQKPDEIAVFIASPGDLAPERKAFKDVIAELNEGFADGLGVEFTALGWEDVLAQTGRRPQSVINHEVDRCDFFVLVLHRRWGQAAPDSHYSSYTEEEFERAFDRWAKTKSPEIVVFFKNVDQDSLADPGVELAKVIAFRKKLEEGRRTMFRRFSSGTEFAKDIDKHLRAFAKGEWKELDRDVDAVDLPQKNIDSLNKLRPDLTLVEAEQAALVMARAALEAAGNRNIEDAAVLFSKACEGTTNLDILSAAAEFFRQIGDMDSSGRLIHRQAALAQDRTIAARFYMAVLPKGLMGALQQHVADELFSGHDPKEAEELRELMMEVSERTNELFLDTMVKNYSTAEILELTRFTASPEGQALVSKQPVIMAQMMRFGRQEAERILSRRQPELHSEEPKTIEATANLQIVDARDVTAPETSVVSKNPADGENN